MDVITISKMFGNILTQRKEYETGVEFAKNDLEKVIHELSETSCEKLEIIDNNGLFFFACSASEKDHEWIQIYTYNDMCFDNTACFGSNYDTSYLSDFQRGYCAALFKAGIKNVYKRTGDEPETFYVEVRIK